MPGVLNAWRFDMLFRRVWIVMVALSALFGTVGFAADQIIPVEAAWGPQARVATGRFTYNTSTGELFSAADDGSQSSLKSFGIQLFSENGIHAGYRTAINFTRRHFLGKVAALPRNSRRSSRKRECRAHQRLTALGKGFGRTRNRSCGHLLWMRRQRVFP